MRVRISIGQALIDWRGCDVTPEQVAVLIDQLAAKAADVPETVEAEPESDKPPVGFAAPVLDKAGPLDPEHFYTDDEPYT